MRHKHLCIAAILSATLLGQAETAPVAAQYSSLTRSENSMVLVINMRSYRWRLPQFRMAGRDAYAVVEVENPHDYRLEMYVSCRTQDGRIPAMTGYYTIAPHDFLNMDTRRMRDPLQRGEGAMVTCRFRADGKASVKAWVYDARNEAGT